MAKYESQTNLVVCIICLVLILANVLLGLDPQANQDKYIARDAQGQIGPATIFILSWTITAVVTGILLLVRVVTGIIFKELLRVSTISVIGLIILTFLTPIILLDMM
ncbi:MAG TPA: hypothetical protein VGD40_13065 [Chryseosolibacter sp.]